MKLYKFKSLEGDGFLHSLDMIVNQRIFLPPCKALNDPLEGSWNRTESIVELLVDNNSIDIRDKLFFKIALKRTVSFTRCFKNELLWAHYAGGYSGVCFEYDLSPEEYDIRKIEYNGPPSISIEQTKEILDGKLQPQDLGILNSKSSCWEYENEYRLFQNEYSKDEYISAVPTRIIFGMRGLKYDSVFRQISNKYGIQITYLMSNNNEFSTLDL
ncbi:DUF2971 domain-containing protein [uncultured Psychrosphaera sp.]|jgi:hypothetical protein|uniref:DUF2971 domain-containing protein n=1 Tax=uncultured Psychrosphaera sp. TaxID=1403522 RepID=UPI00261AEB5C|nr:DUF2971 domain-containing protein [uncultured Psychrosphaera sp.]